MSLKLIHVADSHLGPSRSKLDPEMGLNARLMDTYRCLRFAVEDGIERGGQVVLFAGDLFHGCRPTPTERRLALQAFEPALSKQVPVVLLLGNHDQPRSPSEKHALDTLRDVDGLTIVDQPQTLYAGTDAWNYDPPRFVVTSNDVRDGDPFKPKLQIACAPWPNRQLLLKDEENRKLSVGELNLLMREKMNDVLRGLAAQRVEGIPSVLLGHFAVDTAAAGKQNTLMLLGGDWTINLHDLAALGFDACLLGHIHKPQMLNSDPLIIYSGSPEAVTFGEEGEAKIYNLIEIEDGRVSAEPIETPYRKFVTLDLFTLDESGDIVDPESLRGAIVRVKVPATSAVNLVDLRRQLEAAGAWEYQIETERAETVRRRSAEISAEMALEGALDAYLDQRPELKPMREALRCEAQEIEQELAGVS